MHQALEHSTAQATMSKTPPSRPKKPSKPKTSGHAPPDPHPSGDALGFRSFEAMARVEIQLPVDAHVVGEPVTVTAIHYPDLPRAGLRATCRRADRSHEVGFDDLVFAPGSPGASVSARYREWLGLSADGAATQTATRTSRVTSTAPRFDVRALGLAPLDLHEHGDWDPDDEYWGEEGEPIDDWARPIIARGKRPMFELEQVIPGVDPDDFDSDPILEAAELHRAGDVRSAYAVLMNLLAQDFRCLDAHAHLGNLEFERNPEQAMLHYEMGTLIGELSLAKTFDGVLPWGFIDNRPYLRCLHGMGLCAWRLRDPRAARAVFTKMLWLNPGDNQGARVNLAAVEAGKTWTEMQGDEG